MQEKTIQNLLSKQLIKIRQKNFLFKARHCFEGDELTNKLVTDVKNSYQDFACETYKDGIYGVIRLNDLKKLMCL